MMTVWLRYKQAGWNSVGSRRAQAGQSHGRYGRFAARSSCGVLAEQVSFMWK